jgi:hypothetical protein
VRDEQRQRLIDWCGGPDPHGDVPSEQRRRYREVGRLAGHLVGAQPRRRHVPGELDDRFVPERPGRAQRVARVADLLVATVAVVQPEAVLHPVHPRAGEFELPQPVGELEVQVRAGEGECGQQPGRVQRRVGVGQPERDGSLGHERLRLGDHRPISATAHT